MPTKAFFATFPAALIFLKADSCPVDVEVECKALLEKRLSYTGDMFSVRRDIIAEKVIAAWPKIGEAAVCPIIDFVDEHLPDAVRVPSSCLLPEASWPDEAPRSKVYASDAEWYAIVKAGIVRGIFAECPEHIIFRGKCGRMVLAGLFAVDKFKLVDR